MPDKSEGRIAELEVLETIVKNIVLPRLEQAYKDAERERSEKFPNDLTDDEIEPLMSGSPMWDDPPDGWTKEQLVTWSRGYLYGREVVGSNLSGYFPFLIKALMHPTDFWRRHQIGYLMLCAGTPCICGGSYRVDEERVGLVCNTCHAFYTYAQVCEIEEQEHAEETAKREH